MRRLQHLAIPYIPAVPDPTIFQFQGQGVPVLDKFLAKSIDGKHHIKEKPASTFVETGLCLSGGGRGIRTHETFLPTGFQDQLHRPLGQASAEEFSGY